MVRGGHTRRPMSTRRRPGLPPPRVLPTQAGTRAMLETRIPACWHFMPQGGSHATSPGPARSRGRGGLNRMRFVARFAPQFERRCCATVAAAGGDQEPHSRAISIAYGLTRTRTHKTCNRERVVQCVARTPNRFMCNATASSNPRQQSRPSSRIRPLSQSSFFADEVGSCGSWSSKSRPWCQCWWRSRTFPTPRSPPPCGCWYKARPVKSNALSISQIRLLS